MSQLDLFSDHKPKARLYQFPSSHCVTEAHAIASRLDDLDYQSGKAMWDSICRDRRNGLRREGLRNPEIKLAIDELAELVHVELRNIRIQKQYRPPAVILSLRGALIHPVPHGEGAGAAGALGQGTKSLAGLGGAHEQTEYDVARARDGGAA